MIASRQIKRKKASLPVNVRRSKTSLLKFALKCTKKRDASLNVVILPIKTYRFFAVLVAVVVI